MAVVGNKLLKLIQMIINSKKSPNIDLETKSVDDISALFKSEIVDIVDEFFDSVDLFIDGKPTISAETSVKVFQNKSNPDKKFFLFNAVRPQESWRNDIDNSTAPWIPIIEYKPHATKPLNPIYERDRKATSNRNAKGLSYVFALKESGSKIENEEGEIVILSYPHPYYDEIMTFELKPEMLTPTPRKKYALLWETPCHWVYTFDQLNQMIVKLQNVTEIAVDLEHHSYRSFIGFACLIQISTREEDFLVDTIELRKELQVLNDIFANPAITKVFHGAENDIRWLQYDFGIYVVNMFDTFHASKVLNFESHSLAFLLLHYCGLKIDKTYQLADWRIRPLPPEMKNYAREDSHYLLYIYDCMRNDAYDKGDERQNLLRSIWMRSRDTCLLTFEKPMINEDSYAEYLEKNDVTLNETQKKVFKILFEWRDHISRQEDESLRFVLPSHMLTQIASQIPTNVLELYECCKPLPPLVKLHAHELVLMIQAIVDKNKTMVVPRDNSMTFQVNTNTEPLQGPAPGTLKTSYHDPFLDRIDDTSTPKIKVKALTSKINAGLLANKPSRNSIFSEDIMSE